MATTMIGRRGFLGAGAAAALGAGAAYARQQVETVTLPDGSVVTRTVGTPAPADPVLTALNQILTEAQIELGVDPTRADAWRAIETATRIQVARYDGTPLGQFVQDRVRTLTDADRAALAGQSMSHAVPMRQPFAAASLDSSVSLMASLGPAALLREVANTQHQIGVGVRTKAMGPLVTAPDGTRKPLWTPGDSCDNWERGCDYANGLALTICFLVAMGQIELAPECASFTLGAKTLCWGIGLYCGGGL